MVVGEVGRGGDDVVDLVQLVDAAFGSIEGDDRAAFVSNCILNLPGGLVVMLGLNEGVAGCYLAYALS